MRHPEHAESFSSVHAKGLAEPNAANAAKPDCGVLPSATVSVHLLAVATPKRVKSSYLGPSCVFSATFHHLHLHIFLGLSFFNNTLNK